MVKQFLLGGAATVLLAGAMGASAQGAASPPAPANGLTPVEVEGPILSFTNSSKTLNVMGIDVVVNGQTVAVSPTADRKALDLDGMDPLDRISFGKWFRGARLPGRKQRGFLGGTAIVLGNYDEVAQVIIADEVFTEPAENVVLGVLDEASCSTSTCNADGVDFLRGNNGPRMYAVNDPRMPAGPITDEGGFELDMSGMGDLLAGGAYIPYAMEGYYGDKGYPLPEDDVALHFFNIELAGFYESLLANPAIHEVSALRASCRPGDRLEVRGNTHAPNVAGETGAKGVIEVRFPVGGVDVVRTTADIIDVAEVGTSIFGEYRIRFDTPVCPEEVTVSWLDTVGGTPFTPGSPTIPVALDITP